MRFIAIYIVLKKLWGYNIYTFTYQKTLLHTLRSSRPEVFLRKSSLKICRKFTGEHPCRNVISIKLLCNFIEIALRHGCSPVNLLHIFRAPFIKNTSGRLLLYTFVAFFWYRFKSLQCMLNYIWKWILWWH